MAIGLTNLPLGSTLFPLVLDCCTIVCLVPIGYSRGRFLHATLGGAVQFEGDYLFGTDDTGRRLRFTRAERGILRELATRPGQLVRRDQLLDAMSGEDAETSDRTVDFVINRLRRKLGDSARQPRYIVTQYGEGYVWLPTEPARTTANAFIVIGPLRGVPMDPMIAPIARAFAEHLRAGLMLRVRKHQPVVVDQFCPPAGKFGASRPHFAVELDFVSGVGARLDCAITLKDFQSARVLHVQRHTIADRASDPIDAIPETLLGALWQALLDVRSHAAPTEQPLPLRMHEASQQLVGDGGWFETESRLRALYEAAPNHRLAALLATAIHSRGLMGGPLSMLREDRRVTDLEEIDHLVLPAVTAMQDDPLMTLGLAKLLYFVDRGHDRLAVELSEAAFHQSTALATSYAVLGQMYMFDGDLDEATRLFRSGLDLAPAGSPFAIYMRVLIAQAALAGGSADLARATIEDYRINHPREYEGTRFMFVPPDISIDEPGWPAVFEYVDAAYAEASLRYSHFYCGRLFRDPEQGSNVTAGMRTLFSAQFGPNFSAQTK